MKDTAVALLVIFLLCVSASHSRASWLIDAERYHTSVHGQLSCLDCHETITAEDNHPDPLNVNRSIDDFFSPDKCFQCHDDVEDEIDQGQHAGKVATDVQTLENCIACHDPHNQLTSYSEVTPAVLKQAEGKKCALCHELQGELPEMPAADQACMACHRALPAGELDTVRKTMEFCFHCHGADALMTARYHAGQPFLNVADYGDTPHSEISCLACHPRAAAYDHANQPSGDCGQCHVRHHEKVAHEAHAVVSCGACHLGGGEPQKNPDNGLIQWKGLSDPSGFSRVHLMEGAMRDGSCMRCHFSGNTIGASAIVLPAKSIMCMPCHTATFSADDITTILALIIFTIGMLGVGSVWFSGVTAHDASASKVTSLWGSLFRTLFSAGLMAILKALILDGLLQRRLYRLSRGRWWLHAMVFYPFVFRFIWGSVGLMSSLWWPGSSLAEVMVDKNHPLTAFFFDISGILVIAGVLGMIVRRVQERTENKIQGYPPPDWTGFALLGGIMLVGFLLEGMRMAMTGSPSGAPWAFVGNLVSRILSGFELMNLYGYVWYLHAVLTGMFVAYLPFSRMFHMIMAPVVLAVNAASSTHKQN
jgi:nitrate reductase gamma subunit